MKNILTLLVLFSLVFAFNSCKKEDDKSPGTGLTQSGDQITTNISGVVRDLQGNPVTGAQVTAGGQTATTNSSGVYMLQNVSVNKTRAVVSAVKTGYWLQQKGFIAHASTTCYADIVLFADDKSYSVNSSSGGTVTMPGGSSITFPANAFEDASGNAFSGNVIITAHEILTTEFRFTMKSPGGDFLAENSAGEEGILISYGMAGAKLYDAAGNTLKLAAGKSALVKFPVNPSQSANAPATIALWHYDETKMKWVEEGTATLTGNYYEGNVSHFSWWNCDDFTYTASLTMQVLACGLPAVNALVELSAPGVNTGYNWTGTNGFCSGIIPSNTVFTVNIYLNGSFSNPDTTYIIGPFPQGSVNSLPVISINSAGCNTVSGNLTNCLNNVINGNVALILNNQPYATTTTSGGGYVFANLVPGTYQVIANSGQLTGSSSFTVQSGTNGQSIVLNLQLCDTITTGTNNFNLSFTSFSTGTINFSVDVTQAVYNISNGLKTITFTYLDSVSGALTNLIIGTPGYAPGSYGWNGFDSYVDGFVMYLGQPASLTSVAGLTTLTNTPPVGSPIQGSFSGQVIMDAGNGITIPGTLTGNFSVVRTQ
jgi:hypothetical protein